MGKEEASSWNLTFNVDLKLRAILFCFVFVFCFVFCSGADMAATKHKVTWEDNRPGGLRFDHVPFIVVNHKVYDCQHGVDRHLCEKKRNQAVGFSNVVL